MDRRSVARVARIALVAVAMTSASVSCGVEDTADPAASPDDPVADVPDPGAPDPGPGEPRVLSPEPGLVGLVETSIDGATLVADDEVHVRFYSGVEECYGLDHVVVEETTESVTATVVTGGRQDAEVCIEIAELVATVITLDAPLAGRALVDGATGHTVTVQ